MAAKSTIRKAVTSCLREIALACSYQAAPQQAEHGVHQAEARKQDGEGTTGFGKQRFFPRLGVKQGKFAYPFGCLTHEFKANKAAHGQPSQGKARRQGWYGIRNECRDMVVLRNVKHDRIDHGVQSRDLRVPKTLGTPGTGNEHKGQW
jgi:hypothetical protein